MSAPVDVAPPPSTVREGDAAQWQRLSPRMLAVHPIQELLRGSPALIALLLLGHDKANGDYWTLAAIVVVLALGVARWLTTTYRITGRHVQVRRGILKRSVVSAPRDRIRSVDLTSHWLHRLLGLARVTVGTGISDRKDNGLKLDALTVAQAASLREQLLHGGSAPVVLPSARTPAARTPQARRTARDEVADPGTLARWSPSWIRYGPLSLSGIVTVLVLFAFTSQFVSAAHVHLDRVGVLHAVADQLRAVPALVAVLEVVVAAAVVVALFSTLRYVVRFWNFTLSRTGQGTLHVSHGLVTTRSTTIEERRLRGVEVSQSLPLRVAGAARLVAVTTGLQVGRGAERGGSLLLPPAPVAVVRAVAGDVLEDRAVLAAALAPHGIRAHRRRYTRALGLATVVVGVLLLLSLSAGWPDWAWQASLALYPIGLLLAADRYRNLGHTVVDGWLVSRRGSLVRRHSAVTGEGVVGWRMHRTFFQRRVGLMTLVATTAAGRQRYPVLDVDLATGVAVADATTPGLLTPFLADRPG